MTRSADAIIIGAGVIGAATAFELAKQGWKTLSVDRNTQAGHGSTAGSFAIIRMHYSTFDGTAFAWEGYHYWRDWAGYLEARDPNGLARFRETGCLVMKTARNGWLEKHIENSRALGCPFEEWDAEAITRRLPVYDLTGYFPPKRMEQPGSEDPPCDPHRWIEDDTDYDRDFSDQWTTQAMRYGQRVPSLGIPSKMRGVVDLYDASDDWIPIYDRSMLPGFYMACGSSGNQYKNAPIAGKMMAALVDYCEAGGDHDTAPLRFTLPYIGREIDVGFYSRKREINTESSFSVLG